MRTRTIKPVLMNTKFELLEELRVCFAQTLDFALKYAVKSGRWHQFELQQDLWCKFNKNGYHTQHLPQIFKTASEMIKSCLKLCKSNCRTRFPKVRTQTQPLILFCNTFKLTNKEGKIFLTIAYKPYNPIVAELKLTGRDKMVLLQAMHRQGRNVRDVKILKRDGRWTAHISIREEVNLPRLEQCKTVVGVDIGINYLTTATAITEDAKIHLPLHVKGKVWRHIQREKRAKLRVFQSKGAYTKDV